MPFGDGTGPGGMGPMTGRRAGYCSGFAVPGFANPALGAGWRRPYGYSYGVYGMAGPYMGYGLPALGRGRRRGRFAVIPRRYMGW